MRLEVADGERVGAAAGQRVDLLEVLEVHDDAPDVAGEAHPPPVGGHRERLGVVAAEEEQRVAARPAVDRVAAVAGRPAEAVEVAAQGGHVVAAPALDVVEVVAADQQVVARAAEQDVGAVAAVERHPHRGGRGAQDVVAGAAAHGQPVARLRAVDRHERRSEHGHGAAEREDGGLVVVARAGDGDAVGAAVAGAEVEPDLLDEDVGEVADLDGVGAAAEIGADALERVQPRLERLVAELDLDAVAVRLDLDAVVAGAALDQQRAVLDPHRRGPLDELALAVARAGALQVAADPLREIAGEPGVLERGDEQQAAVERHGAAEQPLLRVGVGEQAVAQRLRGDAGDLEQDRVDLAVAPAQVVEREHGLLQEPAAAGSPCRRYSTAKTAAPAVLSPTPKTHR